VALAALLPSVALADRGITPLVGLRQGTLEFSAGVACIAVVGVRCPEFGRTGESSALGFLVDLPVGDRLDLEVLVNRQASEVLFYYDTGEVVLDRGPADFDVTHIHAGLRKRWEIGRFVPYGAFGVGFSILESERLFDGPIDLTRGSASVAAGARVRLSGRLGLRLEGRAYRVDLSEEMRPYMKRRSSEGFDQSELTAGLAVFF
jgi:hypothetical protein